MTDMSGAIAGTQNNVFFLFPCTKTPSNMMWSFSIIQDVMIKWGVGFLSLTMNLATRRNARNAAPITIVGQFHCRHSSIFEIQRVWFYILNIEVGGERELTPWWAELKTECMTEIRSAFLVKFLMPKNPLSCWRAMVMAAPPMKPTTAAWERKSIKNPSLSHKHNHALRFSVSTFMKPTKSKFHSL